MRYLKAEIRQQVIERARGCCEYCRVGSTDRLLPFAVDHIIAIKHGGTDDLNNLCFACFKCNGFKGTDLASIDPFTQTPSFLFNPRLQEWDDHFQLDNAYILGLTPIGRATAFLLRLNDSARLVQRELLLKVQRYPC